jgi:hypothetical protein
VKVKKTGVLMRPLNPDQSLTEPLSTCMVGSELSWKQNRCLRQDFIVPHGIRGVRIVQDGVLESQVCGSIKFDLFNATDCSFS